MDITYEDLHWFLYKLRQRGADLRSTPEAQAVEQLLAGTPPPSGPVTPAHEPPVIALLKICPYSERPVKSAMVIPQLFEEIC